MLRHCISVVREIKVPWRFQGEGTSTRAAHSAEILVDNELLTMSIDIAIWDGNQGQRRGE